jgi:hypothetical protein
VIARAVLALSLFAVFTKDANCAALIGQAEQNKNLPKE